MDAVDVVAEDLRRRFQATGVSFLIVDLTGRAVARLSTAGAVEGGREAERIPMFGSVYEQVIRTQRLYQEATDRGQRVIVPVTNRGDAIGLLELLLPAAPGEDTLKAVGEAAHVLAYVVIANGRFTDFYTWGKRSRPPTLAAEIQYQLLPPSLSCEAAQFTLCGNLEPSENLSGDTFDYTLDRDTLHVSVTDPMGHDIGAALAATVLVGALRGARRAGADLAEQARLADRALTAHDHGHATGQLLRIDLRTGRAHLVNAGHPWPLRLRDGITEVVTCEEPESGWYWPRRAPLHGRLRPHVAPMPRECVGAMGAKEDGSDAPGLDRGADHDHRIPSSSNAPRRSQVSLSARRRVLSSHPPSRRPTSSPPSTATSSTCLRATRRWPSRA
ncbi:PP2C family protein-serine/threonine phosphatase [Streptomyces sp. NBC_01281]|uniref:PP2C family protein-serine/threonine phosphatase n=1 Tax=Streptomyces sp. NBC_01281 TaxID=2903811 RepID=UPI003DA23023